MYKANIFLQRRVLVRKITNKQKEIKICQFMEMPNVICNGMRKQNKKLNVQIALLSIRKFQMKKQNQKGVILYPLIDIKH